MRMHRIGVSAIATIIITSISSFALPGAEFKSSSRAGRGFPLTVRADFLNALNYLNFFLNPNGGHDRLGGGPNRTPLAGARTPVLPAERSGLSLRIDS